jgi:hypothetical protein
MKTTCAFALLLAGLLTGCSSIYYGTMERFGVAKRDLLVDRVEKARGAQDDAKEQFQSALDQFIALTGADGGELQQRYDRLAREYERSETKANEVRTRIRATEDVARALFREWRQELGHYSDPALRRASEEQLRATERRYGDLIEVMKRASSAMDPVLARFKDQVLFLKHNLNAQVVASLGATAQTLQRDIAGLIADMERSIAEADAFIQAMKPAP